MDGWNSARCVIRICISDQYTPKLAYCIAYRQGRAGRGVAYEVLLYFILFYFTLVLHWGSELPVSVPVLRQPTSP